MNRIQYIDLFKGIAMLMVVMCHTAQIYITPAGKWFAFGQMGCQIFFVLSAFGLCLSYSKKPSKYFTFERNKFLRLASSYWLAIAFYILLALALLSTIGANLLQTTLKPLHIIANFLLLHGLYDSEANNHLVRGGWFIGTLFLFYLIFPLMYRLYFKSASKWWIKYRCILFVVAITVICCALITILKYLFAIDTGNNHFWYFNIISQLPCLSLGFVLYDFCYLHTRITLINTYIALILSIISWVISVHIFFGFSTISLMIVFMPLSVGIAFSLLYFAIIYMAKNLQIKNLIGRIFVKIGFYSLGIYIFHSLFAYELNERINGYINDYIYIALYKINPSLDIATPYFGYLLMLMIVMGLSYLVSKYFVRLSNRTFKVLQKGADRIFCRDKATE